jgi:hypothetical protein
VEALYRSGIFIDFALFVIVVEVVGLFVYSARKQNALRPADILGQVAAGAFLLLGARCAITGADYRLTVLCLAASFPAHLFDLVRRAKASSVSPSSTTTPSS